MKYFTVVFVLLTIVGRAQVWEDFSDGEIYQDPEWTGDHEKFKVSSSSAIPEGMRPALQLDDEGADSAYLSLETGSFPSMQWECWIKLSFNSSSSNNACIYLGSSHEDPCQAEEGYFIQVGDANDSVWFGKKDTAGISSLLKLPGLYTGNSTNALRLKVIREDNGNWKFFGNPSGGTLLDYLGNVEVTDPLSGTYFSLGCSYTSSNSTKFYFDDIYCGPEIVDTTGPVLLQAKVGSPTRLELLFDEAVDENSASIVTNYSLTDGPGNPYQAFRTLDPQQVLLFFDEEVAEAQVYLLSVKDVTDISGNSMRDTVVEISYYAPRAYDIIINEILADPTPAILLPEYEYIELYNRTGWNVGLDGWELDISGKTHEINNAQIEAQGYLLLMDTDAMLDFQFCGPAVGFESFSISNQDAEINLLDQEGNSICHTLYSVEKYTDTDKSNGGWSLERIDPFYPCDDNNSWMASKNEIGGTPGAENSILMEMEITSSVITACCLPESTLLLKFNKSMCPLSLTDTSLYHADRGLNRPLKAEVSGASASEVVLTFDQDFTPGYIYTLTISPDLLDCIEIPTNEEIKAVFSAPASCEPFDLIFNEVLFNPLAGGAEYIELYNRSEKTIHLDELILAYSREVPPNPPDTDHYVISENCRPLLPGGYIALSKYPEKVKAQYHVEQSSSLFRVSPFPSLNNVEGKLLLQNADNVTIDGLDYKEEMHYPLLNSYSGVALERICTEIYCDGTENWHSASSFSGYGTPGYQNSQYRNASVKEDALVLDPVVFSPNGDGKDDVLGISCHFDEEGLLINILIFSEDGRLARELVNNALAGTTNTYFWDGLTESQGLAPPGIYIVLLECVSMKGYSRKFKKVAVLL